MHPDFGRRTSSPALAPSASQAGSAYGGQTYGRSRTATTVNGTLPGPLVRGREGGTVALRVANRTNEPASIHWHGLRGNGRPVLTHADLRGAFPDPVGRAPTRTIELHLTGPMEKFVWPFDGLKFAHAQPPRLRFGERVRIVFVGVRPARPARRRRAGRAESSPKSI
ncbi:MULTISPECIES: multicopper oxidase domain-containing protein [Burkholderia]|uniref:Copper resistance A domain protein n=1 Tax=Burkholderia cepacia TaxID=292 RepID=A0AA89CFJ0_BURCE|nr:MULTISPECIES: multicopper oxidase domain-containing protein [Burkholderia]KGB92815.1 copper resistance A domain protein [Burkholderia cepacia]